MRARLLCELPSICGHLVFETAHTCHCHVKSSHRIALHQVQQGQTYAFYFFAQSVEAEKSWTAHFATGPDTLSVATYCKPPPCDRLLLTTPDKACVQVRAASPPASS